MHLESDLSRVLQKAQDDFLSSHKLSECVRLFETISSRYREGKSSFLQTHDERMVYLFTRMPATYAAVFKVIQEIHARQPNFRPQSLLDVGAGPGTGMWAVQDFFPSIDQMTLIEKDHDFLSIGRKLASQAESTKVQNAKWTHTEMEKLSDLAQHDLTLLSYSIGEVPEKYWPEILSVLWRSTRSVLAIIEPGTPAGYHRILKIRDFLLKEGSFLWAPCPHTDKCPLKEGDWCHFSARVQRTSFHRQLKSGGLGHEDEKYSYMIFGKQPLSFPSARILRHPIVRSGHINVVLCTEKGIQNQTYSKKDKEEYKKIKKLNWGDCF